MSYRRAERTRILPFVIAALTTVGGTAALAVTGPPSQAATTSLCSSQTASVGGGTYIVQNNEWGSSAPECITTDGGTDFTVASSSIANSTSGAPGGYPSIYQGCHWGACSSGGLTTTPVQASNLSAGKVTTSWSTTQPGGSNDYDVAYDIWFNKTSTTTGQPNCLELMVWLNHNGPVQPFGSQVASNVSVGGHSYNVWEGAQSTWNTVSYTMTTGTTSVSNLDVGQLAQDAINRGYMSSSCWLIDVEAGFELWQGGAGLATNSFSVNVGGGGGGTGNTVTVTNPGSEAGTVGTAASVQVHASDSASGQTLTYGASGLPPGLSVNSATGLISGTPTTAGTYNVTVTARDGTGASGSAAFTWTVSSSGGGGGSGACTAAYSVVNSWSGGYQGQITVTAGSSGLSSWQVGWTFPGSQQISQMWNASYSQTGANVTATSMSYNGTLGAGASTTFGFIATGSDTAPGSLTCT
jgi:Glycosyl hydrolase family 12/Cellulose binding domain/Putative Ig domain